LEPAQRSAREAQVLAERTHAMLAEREQRIVELSAEVESARQRITMERGAVADARAEVELGRATAAESLQRFEQLGAELESARQALAQQSEFAREAAAAAHARQGALSDLEAQLLALRGQVAANERELEDRGQRITDLEHALAEFRGEIERKEREIG